LEVYTHLRVEAFTISPFLGAREHDTDILRSIRV